MTQPTFTDSMQKGQNKLASYYQSAAQLEARTKYADLDPAGDPATLTGNNRASKRMALFITVAFVAVWLAVFLYGMLAPNTFWP